MDLTDIRDFDDKIRSEIDSDMDRKDLRAVHEENPMGNLIQTVYKGEFDSDLK